ncbi:hypothetical protein WJX81_004237 [Elliptochloris bilobata]|uniref:Cytidyltransferase-like domain-containing protein n=1 Tax=Elliptochloris bilobata TaxID=381761 RepID=A0AAW1S9F5_9CHLO
MFDLAEHALAEAGFDVLGGYLSPVNDSYGKPGLLPAEHRLRMCELAADAAPNVMVDRWEAAQPAYQRNLWVLQSVQGRLRTSLKAASMLLCGADVVASFGAPGVWREEHLRGILCDHGVVCIARQGTDVEALLSQEGTLVQELRGHVLVVTDPVASALSSTAVRAQTAQGRPIKYLTPDAVVGYIHGNHLYAASKA